ncbi:MAG: hypothetical protein IT260_13685 [Saprospiraceae bacterium]|nr:hypothetical protein [Saprospiraceae bacterium]
MANNLQISTGTGEARPLTKAQKQFNRLVATITELRRRIEEVKKLDRLLRQLGNTHILSAEKASQARFRELVMALHHNPHFGSLKPRLAQKFDLIMLENIGILLSSQEDQEDEELRRMYEDYTGGEQTFEEMQAEEEKEARENASVFFQAMFGLDLDPDDFDDPEKMRAKFEAKDAEFAEQARLEAERKASRKKTPAQLASETRQQAAANALKKTVKDIYLDLVRHFHPDKEPDETKRAAKTETMKQITAAYEADDHLQLLQLQMTLLADRDNVFASFNDKDLLYLNKTLQQQVQELENEVAANAPMYNGNPYSDHFAWTPAQMEANIRRYLKELKTQERQVSYTIEMIKTAKGLQQFVKDFDLDEEEFGY